MVRRQRLCHPNSPPTAQASFVLTADILPPAIHKAVLWYLNSLPMRNPALWATNAALTSLLSRMSLKSDEEALLETVLTNITVSCPPVRPCLDPHLVVNSNFWTLEGTVVARLRVLEQASSSLFIFCSARYPSSLYRAKIILTTSQSEAHQNYHPFLYAIMENCNSAMVVNTILQPWEIPILTSYTIANISS